MTSYNRTIHMFTSLRYPTQKIPKHGQIECVIMKWNEQADFTALSALKVALQILGRKFLKILKTHRYTCKAF